MEHIELSRNEEKRALNVLTSDYENIFYLPFGEGEHWNGVRELRPNAELTELITTLFTGEREKVIAGDFGDLLLYEEDREKLWEETRYPVIRQKTEEHLISYVFFRVYFNKVLRYYELKFVLDYENDKPVGIILAVIRNDVVDKYRQQQEHELFQTLENAERTIMERTAELRDRTLALSFANEEVIELLGNVVEFRNRESGAHVRRVKAFTRVLAERMKNDYPEYGLTNEVVDCIVSASSLHDVGKIMISDSILLKQDRLTPEEMEIMKKHSEYGMEILRAAPKSWTAQYTKIALDICYCHHEKWDGKGYPRGLKGDEIPISAQIVSVADCYDALTTPRIYKPAYSPEVSFNMILSGQCGAYSEKILSCFRSCKDQMEEIAANPNAFMEKVSVQLSGENKLNGLHILLVDDSEMNLEINTDILESEGATVTTAENGIQAIERFSQQGPFDAIIMDIVMPEMDGIEASRQIRMLEGNISNRIPIIALTAEGSDLLPLLNAGIDASMAKPLVVGELTRILISCMHNGSIQLQKQLESTLKIANTDSLTKVKSVAAYTDIVATLNNEINNKEKPEFAIIMCDVNDLKEANDRFGHEVGNLYLKNCCKLLCSVFSHSPVYRVGGDEFIVVVQGTDYIERRQKFQKLQEENTRSEKIVEYMDGKASIAFGMADFDPVTDMEVSDVQSRADASMYLDKKMKKDGKPCR